jgi:hypothetical protein
MEVAMLAFLIFFGLPREREEVRDRHLPLWIMVWQCVAAAIFVLAGASAFMIYPATLLGGKEIISSAGLNYKFLGWDIGLSVILAVPLFYLAWKDKWEHGFSFLLIAGAVFTLMLGWVFSPALIVRGEVLAGVISGVLWVIALVGFILWDK